MFDFAIVGGGPAGSMAAFKLQKKGYSTVVFEEHDEIGLPVRCTGLVSHRVVEMHNEGIINEIKGAIVVFPDGHEIIIGGDRTRAYVIDRHAFDKTLAERAMAEGAEYMIGKRVNKIVEKKDFFEINSIKARYVIGADGPKSFTASRFNMGKINFFNAIQGYGKYEISPEYVKIFLNQKIAPGFFSWIVPADTTRIGLATTRKNVSFYFKKFTDMIDAKIEKITAGLIPFGLRKLHRKRVALVGDAGGQVKATSGGGLYTGMMASIILAENAPDFDSYERNYMKGIGKELKKCILMRKIMNKIGDKTLIKFGKMIEKSIQIINEYGDIDYPSIVIKEILKRPSLLLNLI